MILALLAFSALTLAATLWLFVVLKHDLCKRERAAAAQEAAAAASVAEMRAEIEAVRAAFADLEDRTGMLAAPAPVPSGLNMGRRSRAVRLMRRGDSVEQIAASVGLPLNEARLLMTVERLRASDPDRKPAMQ
jgi:hypothetical protein